MKHTTLSRFSTEFKENRCTCNLPNFLTGMENNFKTYQNQYSTNTLALNKHQHNEERDKRRYLSHKFSLTQLSEFKWNGALVGRKNLLINTLMMTIIQLENNLPAAFLHPNWPLHRTSWNNAVQKCRNPADFALALSILEACVKPVLFNPVWNESLGMCCVIDMEYVVINDILF